MTEQPPRTPSTTAGSVCVMRAAHQVLDGEPRILDDPVSLRLLDASSDPDVAANLIRESAAMFQSPMARALRSHVVLRSRVAEDQLQQSVARGVTQCVVLGAGLDTFAYRQPAWASAIRIFEVDHHASQQAKRKRLNAGHVVVPDNVTYAEIDFETESLRDNLVRHGVSLDRPVFFSWLGVTMYLTQDAVEAVLRMIVSLPVNSEVVFTFAQPPAADRTSIDGPTLAERAAQVGEPWITYFTPEQLDKELRAIGFSHVEFSLPEVTSRLYYEHRADGLPAPRRVNTVIARV